MKSSMKLLTFLFVAISLTAFGLISVTKNGIGLSINSNNAETNSSDITSTEIFNAPKEVDVQIGSRFINVVTKRALSQAVSIRDIIPGMGTSFADHFKELHIKTKDSEIETAKSETGMLTDEQRKLVKSFDAKTNFSVLADPYTKDWKTGKFRKDELTYAMSVIPTYEAHYPGGRYSARKYIQSFVKNFDELIEGKKLDAGRVIFNVSKTGKVENIKLDSSCGIDKLDQYILNAVEEMKDWRPAKDYNGDIVEQQLVVFYGSMGC